MSDKVVVWIDEWVRRDDQKDLYGYAETKVSKVIMKHRIPVGMTTVIVAYTSAGDVWHRIMDGGCSKRDF